MRVPSDFGEQLWSCGGTQRLSNLPKDTQLATGPVLGGKPGQPGSPGMVGTELPWLSESKSQEEPRHRFRHIHVSEGDTEAREKGTAWEHRQEQVDTEPRPERPGAKSAKAQGSM